MRFRSFSIAGAMCLVATAAVDASLLRQIDRGEDNPEILGAASIFVMANILAITLLRIVALRGRDCPFLLGFEVAGGLAILAYLLGFRWWPDRMVQLWLALRTPVEGFCSAYAPRWVQACFYQESWDDYPPELKYPMLLAVLPFMTAPLLLCQLLVALIGGRLAQVLHRKGSGKSLDDPQYYVVP